LAKSFKVIQLQIVASGKAPKGFPTDVLQAARRKLFMITNAAALQDLLMPPGNKLEALKGNRSGQHSIRINDQWRVCFRWSNGAAEDIEITDYH